jgi:hypothetical protein
VSAEASARGRLQLSGRGPLAETVIPARGAASQRGAPATPYGQATPDETRLPAMPHLFCGSGAVLPEKTENALGPAAVRPFSETLLNLPTFRGSDQA